MCKKVIQFVMPFCLIVYTASRAFAFGDPTPYVSPQYVPGTCIVNSDDPFEPDARMPRGPSAGKCIDPRDRRSLVLLEGAQAAKYFPASPGAVVAANFSHAGKFWVAQIPVKAVSELIVQTEFFPVVEIPVVHDEILIAHTEFRYRFANGAKVKLVPQAASSQDAPVELDDLVFSVENVGPDGTDFSAFKGEDGHYAMAYRLVSIADKYQFMIAEQHHKVTQFRVKLTQDQVQAALTEGLNRGQKYGLSRIYNTLDANCSTEITDILRVVLHRSLWVDPALPNLVVPLLKAEGLTDDLEELPNFGDSDGVSL